MICPIKNSDAWKFHEANNTNDYLTWNLNNGNPLNLDKDGNPSAIFDQLLKNINSDRESNPFDKLLNESIKNKLQRLYPEIDLTYSNNPIWEKGNAIMNQSDLDSAVKYTLKAVDILQSPKAEQTFAKGEKAKWDLNKILTELAIPKEQKQLLLDLGITDREQLALELASKYSYSVEVKTATEGKYIGKEEDIDSPYWGHDKYDPDDKQPTQHYSNLTVPGGTNYTENEISTPLITPSIKGHAQFSTDKGIGWFRSDEQAREVAEDEYDIAEWDYNTNTPIVKTDTKTRRILEVQSDLFQKGRDKNVLIKKSKIDIEKAKKQFTKEGHNFSVEALVNTGIPVSMFDYETEQEFEIATSRYKEIISQYEDFTNVEDKENQFLQLLNKDSNWVTFFIKAIIQDSAKKGYEKVLFPKGETAALIEGFIERTEKNDKYEVISLQRGIENSKNTPYKRQGEYQRREIDGKIRNVIVVTFNDATEDIITASGAEEAEQKFKDNHNKYIERNKKIIERFQEKLDLLIKEMSSSDYKPYTTRSVIDASSKENVSVTQFYERKVGNILEKQFGKENVKTITDEYGNQWREITINHVRDLSNILLQKNESEKIIGQANIKAMSVLIDAVNQKQDTLPHEYAHHYIAWYRENPIVKKAIEKWGSEEKLVQAIGEQVVKQKGEAFDWWNQFSKWLINKFSNLSTMQKEDLKNILTDAFLKREDLDKDISKIDRSPVKNGVVELFESNSELSKIGSVQQYSKYLDTIFKTSKVKDIVYHGSNHKFEEFIEDNLNYFGTKDIAKGYGQNIYPVVIEIKTPYYEDGGNLSNQSYEDLYDKLDESNSDGFVSNNKSLFVPKTEEQIHILGSKQDIVGFKDFVNKNTSTKNNFKDFTTFELSEEEKSLEEELRKNCSL